MACLGAVKPTAVDRLQRLFCFLNNLSELRILTTFYFAKKDHQRVTFIASRLLGSFRDPSRVPARRRKKEEKKKLRGKKAAVPRWSARRRPGARRGCWKGWKGGVQKGSQLEV
jgi:hypothetical protein